jgi:ABC-type transporter Mla subunit MlaD
MAKADAKSAMVAGKLQSELVKSINSTGKFAASFTTVKSTSEAFTQSLENILDVVQANSQK